MFNVALCQYYVMQPPTDVGESQVGDAASVAEEQVLGISPNSPQSIIQPVISILYTYSSHCPI